MSEQFKLDREKYPNVEELDGVPCAYMEIPTEQGFVRIVYRILAVQSQNRETLETAGAGYLNAVREALMTHNGGGMIWWRHRPQIEAGSKGGWQFYCRLETSPKLSDDFWDKLPVRLDSEEVPELSDAVEPYSTRRFNKRRSKRFPVTKGAH